MLNFLNRLWILFLCASFFCGSRIDPSASLYAYELPQDFSALPRQDKALIRDLMLINFPPFDWMKENPKHALHDPVYDVVIIGSGMAGLAAGAALYKEGIFHIKIFDKTSMGLEGPWVTYARMKTLRSSKDIMGPALGIPHLTFHAWYEARFGAAAWKEMGKIPTPLWMDYLNWYRQVMQLPIENDCLLTDIIPSQDDEFELHFQKASQPLIVKARKVVLATGRAGFGGPTIPDFAKHLPKSICKHTTDHIDGKDLINKRIGIIGVGASSFDAAAIALEAGAKSVDLLMRRDHIPSVNKFSSLPYKGFNYGYFKLGDEKRWEFMSHAFEAAIPPTIESIKRVEKYPDLRLLAKTRILSIHDHGSQIEVETNRGIFHYDFLILGTGFNIDGNEQPEMRHILHTIALWKDRLPPHIIDQNPKMGSFPYLGPTYEFLPKEKGKAPFLRNLYCFNFGATLSHGLLSSDIPGISVGATRLAQGIAGDFFIQESDWYMNCLNNYEEKDFEESEYSLNIQ